MDKKKKPQVGSKSKKTKDEKHQDSYYFGGLKKEKIKDAPVYGWPGP